MSQLAYLARSGLGRPGNPVLDNGTSLRSSDIARSELVPFTFIV